MYLLKYLNFSKGVLKRYVIYTILWMRSYVRYIQNFTKRDVLIFGRVPESIFRHWAVTSFHVSLN